MPQTKHTLTRILRLIAMLKENQFPNHPKLLREMQNLDPYGTFSFTQKTFQRDIDYLKKQLHAPLEYDYAERGYYLTNSAWNVDLSLMSSSDIQSAMLSTRLAAAILPSPVSTDIRKSFDALLASSDAQPESLHFTLLSLVATGNKVPIPKPIFAEVFHGWQRRRVQEIRYDSAHARKDIVMIAEPQVLAFHEGCWYLKVKVREYKSQTQEHSQDIITLAVHRIKQIITRPEHFENIPELLQEINQGKIFDFPCVQNVRLKLRGKAVIYGRETFLNAQATMHKDGTCTLVIPEVEEYKLLNFVHTWPGETQLTQPKELVDQIINDAMAILKQHQQPDNC